MVAEQVNVESLTSSAPAAMADPSAENKDFFEKAMEQLDQAYMSITTGHLPDVVAYVVINLKELHAALKKNHLEITQTHQEVVR